MMSSSNSTSLVSSREWSKITEQKSRSSSRSSVADNSRSTVCSRLQSSPTAFDVTGLKLSLVGSNISVIDKVPSTLITKVQTLYLSNNHITTLDGIEQFQQLRCLSVANNLIRYLSSLRPLKQSHSLERLSLEGNTVTGMPFYRQYVISLCPNLLNLDGVTVSREERNVDRSTERQLSAFYDQLRLNELQNIVLRNLCMQLNLRAEFSRVVLGKFRSLRSESIPSSRDVAMSIEVGRGRGVGFLLNQCLSGGVFRWLMLACGDDIDKVIQDIAHRAHLSLLQKMGGRERTLVLKDPKSCSAHWENTVAECLRHQQQCRLVLVAECMRNRGEGEGSGEQSDVINVLQQIEFEAAALHTASQQAAGRCSVGGDGSDAMQWVREHRLTYCGVGNHHSHNPVTPTSTPTPSLSASTIPIMAAPPAHSSSSSSCSSSSSNKMRVSFSKSSTNTSDDVSTRNHHGSSTIDSDSQRIPIRESGIKQIKGIGQESNSRPSDRFSNLSSNSRDISPPAPPAPPEPDESELQEIIQARYHFLLTQMRGSKGVKNVPIRTPHTGHTPAPPPPDSIVSTKTEGLTRTPYALTHARRHNSPPLSVPLHVLVPSTTQRNVSPNTHPLHHHLPSNQPSSSRFTSDSSHPHIPSNTHSQSSLRPPGLSLDPTPQGSSENSPDSLTGSKGSYTKDASGDSRDKTDQSREGEREGVVSVREPWKIRQISPRRIGRPISPHTVKGMFNRNVGIRGSIGPRSRSSSPIRISMSPYRIDRRSPVRSGKVKGVKGEYEERSAIDSFNDVIKNKNKRGGISVSPAVRRQSLTQSISPNRAVGTEKRSISPKKESHSRTDSVRAPSLSGARSKVLSFSGVSTSVLIGAVASRYSNPDLTGSIDLAGNDRVISRISIPDQSDGLTDCAEHNGYTASGPVLSVISLLSPLPLSSVPQSEPGSAALSVLSCANDGRGKRSGSSASSRCSSITSQVDMQIVEDSGANRKREFERERERERGSKASGIHAPDSYNARGSDRDSDGHIENDSIGSHDRSKDRESHNVSSSSSRASVSAHGSMSVSVSGAASSSSRRSTSASASVSVSPDSHTSRSRASDSLEVRDNDSATDIDREGEKERERKGYDGSSFSSRASGGGSGSGRLSVSSSKSASAAMQPSSSVSMSPDNQTAVFYTDTHKSRDKDSDRESESERGDEGDRYDVTSSSSVASMSMSGRMSVTSTRSGTGYGSSSVSMSGFTSMSPGTHIPDSHVPERYRGGGGGDTVVSNDRYDGSSSSARGSAREHTNVLVSGMGPRSTSLSNCGHASPDSHAKRSHNDSYQGSGMGGREKMVERDRESDSDVETEREAQREIERERDTGGYDGSSSSSSRSSSHQTRASMLASVSRTASRAVSASCSSSVAPDSIASGSHITDQYRGRDGDRDGGRDRETERYHCSSSSSLASSKTHKSIPASSSDSRVGSVSVSASHSIGNQALGLRVKDEDEERGSDGERGTGSDRESSSQSSRSSTGGRTSGPPLPSGAVSRPSSSQRSTSASASVSPGSHTVRTRTSDRYEVRDSVRATDRGREREMEGQEGSVSSSCAGDSQHVSSRVSASGSVLRSRSHSRPTSRSASVSVSRDSHALGSRVADGYKGKDKGSGRESRSDREREIDRDRKGERERGKERDREGYDSSSSSSTAGGSASVSTSSRRSVPVQRTGLKSVSVNDSASMSPESQRSKLHVTGRHGGRNSDRDGERESGRDSVGVRHQGSSANPLSAIYHDDSPCVSAPASPPSSQTRSQSQSSSSGSEGESSRYEGRNSDSNRDGDKESGSNKDTVGHPRSSPKPRSIVKPRSGSTSASSQSTSPDSEDEGEEEGEEEGEDESLNSASMRSRISEADRGLAIRLESSNGPSTRPSLSRLLRIKVQEPWSPPHTPPEMDVKMHPPVELHGLLVRAKRRVDVLDDWMGEESSAWDVTINMDSIHEEHREAVTIVSGTLYDHEDKQGILGPTPSALIHGRSMERMDSIANGKPSMKMLKSLVEEALHDLAVMRRNEVLSWECNDALRISAKAIRTSVVTLADNGLERLREYRERVVALRADRDAAVHWSECVQSTLDKVEVERLHLEEMREIEDEVLAYKTSCEEGIEKENSKGQSLRHTSSEVYLAIEAMKKEEILESGSKISRDGRLNDAALNLYKRFLSFKRGTFRTLKMRTRKLKVLRIFRGKCVRTADRRRVEYVFSLWKRRREIAVKGRVLAAWTRSDQILRPCLKIWRENEMLGRIADVMFLKVLRWRAVLWVRTLRTMAYARKSATVRKHRREGAALCFFVRKIFFAWSKHTCDCRLDPLREAYGKVRAVRFVKGRVLCAWVTLARESKLRREREAVVVETRRMERVLGFCLLEWRQVIESNRYLYVTRCRLVIRKLCANVRTSRRENKRKYVAEQSIRTSDAPTFITTSESEKRRNRNTSVSANTVYQNRRRKCVLNSWRQWRKVLKLYLHVSHRNKNVLSLNDEVRHEKEKEYESVRTSSEWNTYVLRPFSSATTESEKKKTDENSVKGANNFYVNLNRKLPIRSFNSDHRNVPRKNVPQKSIAEHSVGVVRSSIQSRILALQNISYLENDEEEEEEEDDVRENRNKNEKRRVHGERKIKIIFDSILSASNRIKKKVSKILQMWHTRTVRASNLRNSENSVRRLLIRRKLMTSFSSIATAWIRAAINSISLMQKQQLQAASAYENVPKNVPMDINGVRTVGTDMGHVNRSMNVPLKQQVANMTLKQEHLSLEIDEGAVKLLDILTECEETAKSLQDCHASLHALNKESVSLATECAKLKSESEAIYTVSNRISGQPDPQPLSPETIRYIDYMSNQNGALDYGSIVPLQNDSYSRGLAIEQKVILMQQMEDIYHNAVTAKSASNKEIEMLKCATKKAAHQCSQNKSELSHLDEKIKELKMRRAQPEIALKTYTDSTSIHDIQQRWMATVDHQEVSLRDIEEERSHLVILMRDALKNEESLTAEIDALRNELLEYHTKKIKSDTRQSTTTALKGVDLRGVTLGSLASARTHVLNKITGSARRIVKNSTE